MSDIQEQIKKLEEEIRSTPYHKGTEHHIGKLRARLSRLRDEAMKTSRSGSVKGFTPPKFGDATVALVGFPSVGKSTLINKLTNARSPTADYSFTTVEVIPGMLKYKGASIQLFDLPGLIAQASQGAGRGREVLSVIRSSDLLLIVAEAGKEKDQFNRINTQLYEAGIRINQAPPRVSIKKTTRGGLKIISSVVQQLSIQTIQSIAREFGLMNGEILIYETITLPRLIDALSQNRAYLPALYVVNKVDLLLGQEKMNRDAIKISAKTGYGLGRLKEEIWKKLGLVRIFLKETAKQTSKTPIVVKKGNLLYDVAKKIGSEFAKSKKSAKIWGNGAKYPGQQVSLQHQVEDEMEVFFI